MKRIDIPGIMRAATDRILGSVRLTSNILSKVKNSASSVEGVRNYTILRVNTEAELKAMDLEENNIVDVLGKTTQDDGKGYRVRIVRSSSSGSIQLANGLHAVIIKDIASSDKLGKVKVGNGLEISGEGVMQVDSLDDSITVSADGIKVNTYNGVDSTSTTRPASANAVKTAYDKANTAQETANNKLDAGAVSAEYNTGKKIEDKIKAVQRTADNKLDKGAYTGNAQDLKNEIDEKLPLTGGNVGPLKVNGEIIVNKNIVINTDNNPFVIGTDGANTDNERFYFYFKNQTLGKVISFYKNGSLNLIATNLKTVSKDVVNGINELKNRFENSPVLYEYNGSSSVTNLNVPNLSKYRIIAIKYQVASATDTIPQTGPDITQTLMYMDNENNYFHLFGNQGSRARYIIETDKLIRSTQEGSAGSRIIIRKIYGLIEK